MEDLRTKYSNVPRTANARTIAGSARKSQSDPDFHTKAYGQLWQATEARMVALEKAGMELEVTLPEGTRRIRIPFDHSLQDEGDAQQTLVEMSFNARDILAQQAHQNG